MTDVRLDGLEIEVIEGLEKRAQSHGRSIEDEAASIIREAVAPLPEGMGSRIQARFVPLGGVDLNLPPRPRSRTLPFVFDEMSEDDFE